ncbi:hypothetical protein, partial [Burkholderia cenocepacia]|uniref:hypothetical protein n=1 Tax=Burkholderia cenocepacia TaxID=95486 RepID=UPI002AB10491
FADAARGARDDCGLAAQICCHIRLLPLSDRIKHAPARIRAHREIVAACQASLCTIGPAVRVQNV